MVPAGPATPGRRSRPGLRPSGLAALIPAVVTLLCWAVPDPGPSFTNDETATLAAGAPELPAARPPARQRRCGAWPNYALIGWSGFGGTSEFIVRLPSAVAMAASRRAVVTRSAAGWSPAGRAGRGTDLRVLPSVSWFAEDAREGAVVAALGTMANYGLVRVGRLPGPPRPALADRLRRDPGSLGAGQPVRPADLVVAHAVTVWPWRRGRETARWPVVRWPVNRWPASKAPPGARWPVVRRNRGLVGAAIAAPAR